MIRSSLARTTPTRLSRTLRISVATLAALSLAGIVHIVAVLLVPSQVASSAYQRVAVFGPDRSFHLLPDVLPDWEPLPGLDPAMKHALCRFSLLDGPVRFSANVDAPYWSMGLFNGAGEAVYSLNNRTSGSGELSMLVLSSEQLSILRENPPEDLEDLIVIETEEPEGFALLRALVGDPLQAGLVEAGLTASRCDTLAAV